ncbi:MAG: pirin family protein [Ectothiorhodospiraceae bacterium]|nr:pirin family protein [Ectothiorhodospiraceae bacterium]
MDTRAVRRVVATRPARDGAGVDIRRIAGDPDLDPFLMLDEFGSDDPEGYIAGFPEHPHRGFETVTYMLAGYMEHRDSTGRQGRLGPGDVQWMTAGRGIVHSEMPMQASGRMRGFQLWVNLPAREKMGPPRYQEYAASAIPEVAGDGWRARVIAGTCRGTTGAVSGIATSPTYLDVALASGHAFQQPVDDGHSALVYVYDGEVTIGEARVPAGQAAVLTATGQVRVAADADASMLVLAGRPLGEPVVQYGPFVMNTREEIQQALDDYRAGRIGQ